MTKNFRVLSMVICLNALALPFVAKADSLKQASPADVQMLLKAAKGENTANGATYIGQTKDRVYIEYASLVHTSSIISDKPDFVVYWLPRSKLTADQLAVFEKYKSTHSSQFDPSVLIGKRYNIAREQLQKHGWFPSKPDDPSSVLDKDYPELDGCAADRPFCLFNYKNKEGDCLRITAEGSDIIKDSKVTDFDYGCE